MLLKTRFTTTERVRSSRVTDEMRRTINRARIALASPILPDGRYANELADQVRKALATTGYRCLRSLLFEVKDRTVTLKGQVARYYLKQQALNAVLSIPGTRAICDELVVMAGHQSDAEQVGLG